MPKKKQSSVKCLSALQERFFFEYAKNLFRNATQCCIKAGYSPNAANRQAVKNLNHPIIKLRIQEIKKTMKEKNELTAEAVLQEYIRIAFADYLDNVNPDNGELLPNADGRIIESISVTKTSSGIRRYVKLRSKVKALEILGKYTGLIEDKVTIQKYDDDIEKALREIYGEM
jgi:phage terminase small subunit